ncbi:hypothetical protein [Paraburkholderia heleia]|uniref:hypothetical protein n=1 Tax=Paraburkholderia heleia TaxID=634127 RepID=UPI000AA19920|nr:hypothetical protein [Paraburkholderia heleia]
MTANRATLGKPHAPNARIAAACTAHANWPHYIAACRGTIPPLAAQRPRRAATA